MREAAWHFRWEVEEMGLPEGVEQQFVAGLRINETPRSIRGSRTFIWPADEFRNSWLRRLGMATR